MTQITITEALAELKLIEKKVEKKKEKIFMYLFHADHMEDPLKNEGSSEKHLPLPVKLYALLNGLHQVLFISYWIKRRERVCMIRSA